MRLKSFAAFVFTEARGCYFLSLSGRGWQCVCERAPAYLEKMECYPVVVFAVFSCLLSVSCFIFIVMLCHPVYL